MRHKNPSFFKNLKPLEEWLLDSYKRDWITKEDRPLWEQKMLKRQKELDEAKKRDDEV